MDSVSPVSIWYLNDKHVTKYLYNYNSIYMLYLNRIRVSKHFKKMSGGVNNNKTNDTYCIVTAEPFSDDILFLFYDYNN